MVFMRLFFNRTEGDDMSNSLIDIDTSQIKRLTEELKGYEKEVAEATRLALNRTIDFAITTAGREVSTLYAITAKEVKNSFKGGIKKPTTTKLEASILSRGHTLSLAHFPFTPKTSKRGKKSVFQNAVFAKIKKARGSVLVKNGFVGSTGATSAEKTQYNVFKREGKARLPITPIRTLSIPQMITNDEVGEKISKAASEKLNERLEHEIIRIMTSTQKKVSK